MPINRRRKFPSFDVNNPKAVLDIPDNLNVRFGNYEFSFSKGLKEGRISEKRNEWQYNGDYFIKVNGKPLSDPEIIRRIKEKNVSQMNEFIRKEINHVRDMDVEKDVFDRIDGYDFPKSILPNSDFIKMILYYSWHRCQIEDRLYPPQIRNQMGSQMFIDEIMDNI